MVGTSLSNAVALEWLRSYELAYGRLKDVDEVVRAGLKPVPDRIIDRMRLRLLIRMVNAKQLDPCPVEVVPPLPEANQYGWREL